MAWLEEKIAGSTVLIVAEKHCRDVDAAKDFCLKAGFTGDEIVFELVEPVAMEEAQMLAKIKACPIVWVRENLVGDIEAVRQSWFEGTLPKAKYDMILGTAAKDMVAHSSQSNTLVVFSKITCPPCTEVKIMFEDAGFTKEQTNIVTISNWPTMEHIQDRCREVTGDRGTPRIWIDGKIMGGYKEIKPMFEDESLHELADSLAGKIGPITK